MRVAREHGRFPCPHVPLIQFYTDVSIQLRLERRGGDNREHEGRPPPHVPTIKFQVDFCIPFALGIASTEREGRPPSYSFDAILSRLVNTIAVGIAAKAHGGGPNVTSMPF